MQSCKYAIYAVGIGMWLWLCHATIDFWVCYTTSQLQRDNHHLQSHPKLLSLHEIKPLSLEYSRDPIAYMDWVHLGHKTAVDGEVCSGGFTRRWDAFIPTAFYKWLRTRDAPEIRYSNPQNKSLRSQELSFIPIPCTFSWSILYITYVYIYMYVNIYIYMYVYICIYIYIHVCIYMYIYICMYVCMYVCVYVCVWSCMWMSFSWSILYDAYV